MANSRQRRRSADDKAGQDRPTHLPTVSPLAAEELGALLATFFARSPEGMTLVDPDLMVRAANESFAREICVPLGQIVGRPAEEVIPGWKEHMENIYRRVRETGTPFFAEAHPFVFKGQPGRTVTYWDTSVSPLYGPGGDFVGALLLQREVTKRKLAEMEHEQLFEQLRDVNERLTVTSIRAQELAEEAQRRANELDTIITAIADPVVIYDAHGLPVRANPAAVAAYGLDPVQTPRQEIMQQLAIRHPDGRPVAVDEMPSTRALRGEKVTVTRFVFTNAEGHDLTMLATASPLIINGQIVGAVSVWHDITERERLLAEVERRAAELDATIMSMADGVLICDREGETVRWNPAIARIFGYTPDAFQTPLGEQIAKLRPETIEGKPYALEEAPYVRALHGETVHGALVILHPDDRSVWVSVSAAPIRAPDSRLLGAVSVFTDVTALHELQERMQDFVRTVSHDLRQPLTIIQGHAQLLLKAMEKAGLTGSEIRSAEAIAISTRRMNTMIQDLVDMARLESGQLRLEKRPLDLRAFISELLERSKTAMDISRIRTKIPRRLPPVSADLDRLERIFVNLLTNAVKYSPPNTRVLIRAVKTDGEVMICVADKGVGIAPEDLPHLFERFYRAKGPEKVEGLGLGLYITKMLVEAHGGRIWVESRVQTGRPSEKGRRGRGSTFYFTLPVEEPRA